MTTVWIKLTGEKVGRRRRLLRLGSAAPALLSAVAVLPRLSRFFDRRVDLPEPTVEIRDDVSWRHQGA